MTHSRLEVTILLPCYNEEKTIGACVTEARTAMEATGMTYEILVADNESGDQSRQIAESCGARVVRVPERGYGAALAAGISAAQGKYVVMGDSDCSYDFGEAPQIIEKLKKGYDLVMGNRFAGGIMPGAMPFLHRYLGNPVLSFLGRFLFHIDCRDFHCGLRGFDREAISNLGLRTSGMEFASEMVVKATLAKLRVSEVPVTLRPDKRDRPPHLRTWRDGWRHLRFLLLYSPAWLFLVPGFALLFTGLLVMGILLPGPIRLGGIELDVHTLLYAAMFQIVGFQVIGMGAFARAFAVSHGLLPPGRRGLLDRLIALFRLEIGLVAGALLFLGGIGSGVLAVLRWRSVDFHGLDPVVTLRTVIPSALFLSLGIQTMFFSFVVGIVGLVSVKAPREP